MTSIVSASEAGAARTMDAVLMNIADGDETGTEAFVMQLAPRVESAPRKEWKTRWRVEHRGACIEHVRQGMSMVRRFVVLESKALRDILAMPRRTEIEPLRYETDKGVRLRTTDLDEMAERTAKEMLRQLYARVGDARQALQASKPEPAPRLLGKAVGRAKADLVGWLVYAGESKSRGDVYCIEVLPQSGGIRRVAGDAARAAMRAAEESGIRLGDYVRVSAVDAKVGTLPETAEQLIIKPESQEESRESHDVDRKHRRTTEVGLHPAGSGGVQASDCDERVFQEAQGG